MKKKKIFWMAHISCYWGFSHVSYLELVINMFHAYISSWNYIWGKNMSFICLQIRKNCIQDSSMPKLCHMIFFGGGFIFFFKLHMKLVFIFEKYSKIVYKSRAGFQEYLGWNYNKGCKTNKHKANGYVRISQRES